MPRKTTLASVAHDLIKAGLERKTSQGKLNKVIDAFLEPHFGADEAAHFVNEVLIHKHPRQHVHNTIKYGIKPRLGKTLTKFASDVMK